MTTAPLIHLVCGSTGAGKTTYALALAERIGAVRFSIDEWMADLFWPDAPQPIDGTWAMERVERCYRRIWATAAATAAHRAPCVLDLGFTTAASRSRFADLARAAGLGVQLHFVDVAIEERWRRVQARNASQGETRHLAFAIDRGMFDFVEAMWEPPTEAELAALNGVRA